MKVTFEEFKAMLDKFASEPGHSVVENNSLANSPVTGILYAPGYTAGFSFMPESENVDSTAHIHVISRTGLSTQEVRDMLSAKMGFDFDSGVDERQGSFTEVDNNPDSKSNEMHPVSIFSEKYQVREEPFPQENNEQENHDDDHHDDEENHHDDDHNEGE